MNKANAAGKTYHIGIPLKDRITKAAEKGTSHHILNFLSSLKALIIANGLYSNPISKIIEKNNCTWFSPKVSKLHARKKWIISSIAPKGNVVIDDGAKKALKLGKSLLAAGIKNVSGKFNKGDHIKVLDKKNNECARGLSSFSSDEVKKIMGHHSNEIQKLLGYVAKSEVIHKDDMVEV